MSCFLGKSESQIHGISFALLSLSKFTSQIIPFMFMYRIAFCLLILGLNACIYEHNPYHINRLPHLPQSLNGLKKMHLLQGEQFWMGDNESSHLDEKPAHWVALNQFYMDETPVTYADFEKYVQEGGQHTAYHLYESYHKLNYPVTGMTWHHAIDFCNWRSKVEGFEPAYRQTDQKDAWGFPIWELKPDATGFRLPTEAEFEYAARAGLEKKQFPWGDTFDENKANFDTEKGEKKGEKWRLVSVKSEEPNGFGLYQMTGNIRHWCQDWYDAEIYNKSLKTNPLGGKNFRTKVLRGGGWGATDTDYLRVAKRDFCAPSNYNFDIGFRCVLPAKALLASTAHDKEMGLQVAYDFFRDEKNYQLQYTDQKPDFTGKEMTQRLELFLADYFPNSIYFRQQIDHQEIITPKILAQLITEISTEYQINPLFLTGIMVSESGVGSCSFPRWFNNPLAFRWQNRLMSVGLPTYEDKPNVQNRKFVDLEANFRAFCQGIRRKLYYQAAHQNLHEFHVIYVGYQADEWMRTLSRVYRDVARLRFEANFPTSDAGQFIYLDWAEINPDFIPVYQSENQEDTSKIDAKNLADSETEIQNPKPENQPAQTHDLATENIPIITQKTNRFYLIYGSFAKKKYAFEYLQKPDYQSITNPKIIHSDGRFRVAVADFQTEQEAQNAFSDYAQKFEGVWLMKF